MAQLDRFLNLLVTNSGPALLHPEGEIASVTNKNCARPVMKQALTSAQILTLVREIAPPNQPHSLDAAGNVRFEYSCADGTFEVSLTQNGKIAARIAPRPVGAPKTKPSSTPPVGFTPTAATVSATTPAMAAPAAAPRPDVRPTPAAASAGQGSMAGNRALEKMESLL